MVKHSSWLFPIDQTNSTDEWSTPWSMFRRWNELFRFTLDAAASAPNAKCERFFSKEDNGLNQSWSGFRVFCNPPYSQVDKWMEKASREAKKGTFIVYLVFARIDTEWFHRYAVKADYVISLRGRLTFTRQDGKRGTAPAPSVLIIFNCDIPLRDLMKLGLVWSVKNE